jgi:hypothetical protein
LPADKTDQDTIATAITDVSDRLTQLVHDEIELAKAEVSIKARSLGVGAGIFGAGAAFGHLALIFLLITIALALDSVLAQGVAELWIGFAIVFLGLAIATLVSVLIARRLFRTGPPTPTMAIDEARKIRDTVSASTEAEWLGVDR